MKLISGSFTSAALLAACLITNSSARADDGGDDQSNHYIVTNLVSDIKGLGQAPNTDPVLQNAWGVAFTPAASPFWVSDNATGCSTLYDGDGTVLSLQVGIPLPGGVVPNTACKHVNPPPAAPPNPTPAAPTGMVWNPTTNPMTAFLVPGTTMPASFIWATEDGTISAWTGNLSPNPNNARLAVDNADTTNGPVFKGLVFGVNANGVFLFATNFRAGTVDVFDHTYTKVSTDGGFADPDIPAGFAPFGIQNIDGVLFVTYAKQNAQKHDDVAGPGNGFVDVFDTDGHLLRRFASRGTLNSPWGVARASYAFGRFSGDVLIGNFGNGQVNAFASNGDFLGALRDGKGKPLAIDGLWTLTLGGGAKSSSDTLYFTAGPNGEMDGLFGTITPAANK
ncbi:MAG: TIGR03118 family protein [Alphaproteobacteria bacterium]|nr:TIGR03118 family protein [Alphaproteobacteria bacterium]